ncbi:hypothetical protein P9B03_12810 [Metasolibacillus meyeri]|uniref:Flagellar hook-length control protein-like C-terminal domain-containing protein n=1 Tax=Metasolibacillus meyeri TaxID=1071052 RepID=A0AAW9NVV6_9BACL|nr:hypothetical protein [Metasolibacillus meyeri]MEC1179371.1 hypothetical protein [Metasolibacillus meyeri]
MTSTSFNPVAQQTQVAMTNQPLTLKQGQIFHGTIKQLYPDQMAEIQVGNNKLVAKLEVPLKVGDAHFFQVTNTAGVQTELKVVSNPMSPTLTPAQQMTQLLETMNLPKTADMQQVLGHFMKQQMPISREQLIQAEQWMKNLPEGVSKQDALLAIQRMVEYKMPFTNQVFQALVQGAKTDGMSTALQNLLQQLAGATGGNEQLKASVLGQLQTIAKPFDAELGGTMLARAVQLLSDQTSNISERLQSLQLLKQAGVVPQNATLSNWQAQQAQQAQAPSNSAGQLIMQMLQAKPEQSSAIVEQARAFITNDNLLTTAQKEQLQQLVTRFSQLPQSKQALTTFAQQLQTELVKAYANNTASQLFTKNEQGLSTKEQILSMLKPELTVNNQETLLRNLVQEAKNMQQPAIQSQLTQADAQLQSAVDSKAMEQAMKTVLKGLGISYEATLQNKATDMQAVAQQLKPQLLALIQDTTTPPALRDAAEMVMARMNGMQLLSGENGHQHQLVMQVPLEFFGKKMDATLQWNGRMKEDGKIDANYARVLFYLHMESLQETVIDMQVQNRIVTVTLFNDHLGLAPLAEPLKKSLKEGLASKDYQLSAVFIKQFESVAQEQTERSTKEQIEEHSGVDIRV